MFKKCFDNIAASIRLKSIQFIITSSFTCITIVAMMFVGMTLYDKFTKITIQNASDSTSQIIKQVNLNLNFYIKSMIEISSILDKNISVYEDSQNNKISEEMDVIIKSRQDIVTLAFFSDDGKLIEALPYKNIKNNANVREQQWFSEALHNQNSIYFSQPHVQNLFPEHHSWVLSLSKHISVIRGGKRISGILLVDMNFHAIGELCESVNLGKRGYIYIVDSSGNIVYHPQQQLIYNGIKYENNDDVLKHAQGSFIDKYSGEQRIITVTPVSYTGWKIVGVSYMDAVTSIKKSIGEFVSLVLIFGIIAVCTISILVSGKISKPIKQLEKSMKKVEEGNFDINVDVKGDGEVVGLSKTFNLMVIRIRELMKKIVLVEEAKRESELNALQSQINPHFLYNTLDSIVWMAENGKSDDVIIMVTSLAKLFRISISKGKNIITVKEELEHAKNYLIIQKYRYKNKFKFEFNVEEEVLQLKTLKLILQPIIENSIYHGIEYMIDEGIIIISAKIYKDKLLFEVTDNGLGINGEILKNILSRVPNSKKGSGVGIKNVNERIQLLYGKEYGLQIESEPEEGTITKIFLPIVYDQEDL